MWREAVGKQTFLKPKDGGLSVTVLLKKRQFKCDIHIEGQVHKRQRPDVQTLHRSLQSIKNRVVPIITTSTFICSYHALML